MNQSSDDECSTDYDWDNGTDVRVTKITDRGIKIDVGKDVIVTVEYTILESETELLLIADNGDSKYRETRDRDVFDSRQKIRTIGNDLASSLELSSEWVKTEMLPDVSIVWKNVTEDLDDLFIREKAKEMVSMIRAVEGLPNNDGLKIIIIFDVPESSDYRLTGTQRLSIGYSTLMQQPTKIAPVMMERLAYPISFTEDEWEWVADQIDDKMELSNNSYESEDRIIARCAIEFAESKMAGKICSDPADAVGKWQTYLQPAKDSDYDEPTLWVRSSALQDAIKQGADEPRTAINRIGPELKRMGLSHGKSERLVLGGEQVRCWPLRVSDLDVGHRTKSSTGSGSGSGSDSKGNNSDTDPGTNFDESNEIDGVKIKRIATKIKQDDNTTVHGIMGEFDIHPSQSEQIKQLIHSYSGQQSTGGNA